MIGKLAAALGASACVMAVAVAAPAPAYAQVMAYDIRPGSLKSALDTYARQSRRQVIYRIEDVRGVRSPGARGPLSAAAALEALLAGTGFSPRADSSGAVAIVRVGNAAAPAPGEIEAGSAAANNVSAEEPIVVTGSRIPNVAPTSPLVVLTQENIRRSGAATIEDASRTIPQNFSSVNSSNATQAEESLGILGLGNGAFNLRGLGADATLVLINGRRTAGSAALNGEAVNINTIPLSSVERIEILTDGASAIYGSDAIGGVVNIILKRNRGFSADSHVRYEDSSTSGNSYLVDQAISLGWGSGAIHASVGYRKTEAVNAADFGFTTFDFRDRGGFDQRGIRSGQPGTIDLSFFEFVALPANNNGLNFTAADLISPYIIDPATGNPRLDAIGNPVISPNFPASTRAEFLQASPETRNLSARVGVEQDVNPNIRIFADVLYSENKVNSVLGVPRIEAFVPASNAFNDLGQEVFVSYLPTRELANGVISADTARNNQERLDISGGIQVTNFWRDWGANFTATLARDQQSFSRTQIDVNTPEFEAMIASSNPQQTINLFGNGTAQNNSVLAGLVTVHAAPTIRVKLQGYDLSLNGTVLNLPGGAVRTSIGAEYRREALRGLTASAVRKVSAVFGEIAIPIFGENLRFAGMDSLLLIGAARWEEYSLNGDFNANGQADDDARKFSQLSPRIGIRWRPASDLTILANWSRSFRAPTSTSLFGVPSVFPAGIFSFLDPLAPGGPRVVFPGVTFVANPALHPETATSWTAEITWAPRRIPGLRVSVGYNNTDFVDRLTSGFATIINNSAAVLTNPEVIPGFVVTRDAGGNLTRVLVPRQVNAAVRASEAVDFSASYDFRTNMGAFHLGLAGVRSINVREQAFVGGPLLQLSGTTQGPSRWVGYTRLGWEYGGFDADIFVRHTSSYSNQFFNRQNENRAPERVAAYTTVDLNLSYSFRQTGNVLNGLRLSVGARNLFNADFPFIDNVFGPYDPSRVDVRGRVLFLDVTKSF
jgi:iron complex outermembrane receptor protein